MIGIKKQTEYYLNTSNKLEDFIFEYINFRLSFNRTRIKIITAEKTKWVVMVQETPGTFNITIPKFAPGTEIKIKF